jgi:hypothetical protein
MGHLRLPSSIYGGRRIVLSLHTLVDMMLTTFADGRRVSISPVSAGVATELVVLIPAEAGAVVDLVLVCSKIASPADLGINMDRRVLGFALTGVSILPNLDEIQDVGAAIKDPETFNPWIEKVIS